MQRTNERSYDVVIMGGGPAGSTLGARLARETSLSVALFESEFFPREHIGESFSSLIVPCLQEIGALETVLESECYVRKFGGIYAWDPAEPSVAYFRHRLWEQDRCFRWSLHVNRSEFDHVLLEHARAQGVTVEEGVAVRKVERDADGVRVVLDRDEVVRCRLFVDASGRRNNVDTSNAKAWLSRYKNIAIWGHFIGGKPAQSLAGDWNIFREKDLSPIGCFACPDGWFWYIPVPKRLMGRRMLTHSIGIVTDPRLLSRPDKRFTDIDVFMKTARSVPLLRDLLGDIQPTSDRLLTATNYSMISGRMCDYNARWLLVGDAAYFVDPLFSSGVNFAMAQAAAAALVIQSTLEPSLPEDKIRDLWRDYDASLSDVARSFALAIDQWYAAIAQKHPDSIYWSERATQPAFEARKETFQALINSDLNGDLLRVITQGRGDVDALGDGALASALHRLHESEPREGDLVRLCAGVTIRPSVTISALPDVDPALPRTRPAAIHHGVYWQDPGRFAAEVEPLFGRVNRCLRFCRNGDAAGRQVKFVEELHEGTALHEALKGPGKSYGELLATLTPGQIFLLQQLRMAELVEVQRA